MVFVTGMASRLHAHQRTCRLLAPLLNHFHCGQPDAPQRALQWDVSPECFLLCTHGTRFLLFLHNLIGCSLQLQPAAILIFWHNYFETRLAAGVTCAFFVPYFILKLLGTTILMFLLHVLGK